jgi:hypothetical protein
MAEYHKGTTGSSLGAKDLVGDKVWAIYPHWSGEIDTKRGRALAVRAEVYELTEGAAAVRAGQAVFFQRTFLGLPLAHWSVGMVSGPDDERTYYSFDWPETVDEDVVDAAMATLPDMPALPEAETSDGSDTFPAAPNPETFHEEPF